MPMVEFLERNRKLIDLNKNYMRTFVKHHANAMKWHEPTAGPVSLVRLSSGSATEFCDRARKEARVLLVPGALFAMDTEHFRVGLGRKNFAPGLDELERLFKGT